MPLDRELLSFFAAGDNAKRRFRGWLGFGDLVGVGAPSLFCSSESSVASTLLAVFIAHRLVCPGAQDAGGIGASGLRLQAGRPQQRNTPTNRKKIGCCGFHPNKR